MKKTPKYIVLMGIFSSLTAVFSVIDSYLSSFLPLPGLRFGLANIVIFSIMILIDIPSGCILSILRSLFVLMTRGVTAGLMSFSGGITAIIIAAIMLKKTKSSYKFICIMSALGHTMGQIIAAAVILESRHTLFYAVFLIPAATATGYLSGTLSMIMTDRLRTVINDQ